MQHKIHFLRGEFGFHRDRITWLGDMSEKFGSFTYVTLSQHILKKLIAERCISQCIRKITFMQSAQSIKQHCCNYLFRNRNSRDWCHTSCWLVVEFGCFYSLSFQSKSTNLRNLMTHLHNLNYFSKVNALVLPANCRSYKFERLIAFLFIVLLSMP